MSEILRGLDNENQGSADRPRQSDEREALPKETIDHVFQSQAIPMSASTVVVG